MPSNVDKHSVEGEHPVRLCNYVDVYRNDRIRDDMEFMAATATDAQIERFTLRAQDVLATKDSEEPSDIGVPSHVPRDMPGVICGYHLAVFRPNQEKLHGGFLAWALRSRPVQAYYETAATGISRYALSINDLGMTPVPVPNFSEQQRIADFLDEQTARIDALIAEKEKLAGALKDIEEVTGFDLVTRGVTAVQKRVSYSEPWLAEVPHHWKLSKLRHVARVGNGSTPKRDNDEYWVGGFIPWLNSGSVNSARICEASDFVTETARKECHLPMVRAGSTLVALTGQGKTRGTAAYAELETTINQHLAYISPFDSRITDEFLWVALTGFYSVLRLLSEGEGSTKGALTCEQLNQFRIPLPPVDEQSRIVQAYKARTQAIEGLLVHAREHIERLREYRSSLISAAVAGQLDLGDSKTRREERLAA